MFETLNQLGLDINDKTESKIVLLKNFMQLILDYNKKVNLISRNDTKYLFEKHIYDSLALNLFLQKNHFEAQLKVLDIGTGGGFPSIPLAIWFSNLKITAVDSTAKKINFIEHIKKELTLENIQPICGRIESLNFGNPFDISVSRAVAELRIILEYAIPNLKEGAFFAAYKSVKSKEEIAAAKNALLILNAKIVDEIEYTLPLEDKIKRVLIVIRKESKTPSIYPRKNGVIAKKPL